MTEAFDATTWQDELDAHLAKQPDAELADELRSDWARKARARLATGDGPPLELLSADTILTTDWPEPTWAIPQLLPVGLTILAGKPKVGKSWLALQIAHSVAAGGQALDQDVEAGPVLYLALEDTPRRLQERMKLQAWPDGLPCDFMPMGQFIDQVGDLRNGGGDRLARQIKHKGYRLVVIDTLSRSTTGDQNDVVAMTLALSPVQQIAHDRNCAALMVDHHRKGGGFDPDAITDILGSTAKGAMADTAWGLYRERGKAGAKLAITGRDVDEQNLALKMDWLTGSWQLETGPTGQALKDHEADILKALQAIGPAGVVEIAAALDKDKGNIYHALSDMANLGVIIKTGSGRGKVKYDVL